MPAGPLMRPVETVLGSPAIEWPFTAMITSSGRIPARSAGERLKTPATRSPRLSSRTDMPTPSKAGLSDWRKSFASVGVR